MIPIGLTALQQLQRAITANGPDGSIRQSWIFVKDAAHVGIISDEDMDNEIFRTNGALDLYLHASLDGGFVSVGPMLHLCS